ncbi:conserved hypothetical protein [Crenothrix polyspora]|uniref:Phosphatidylinositol kinase n=1 Tax=Crenothrix polyspora TaxID=360316 RepID=A0A1R4H102_9GAMM|nr:type II toxin-antitoxin system HipA family toxin [Crenothrix polyspora]SJM89895.1 conserved hypothetical protein [Crenothrix polyspora]
MTTERVKKLQVANPSGLCGILARESGYAFAYQPTAITDNQIAIGMPVRTQSYTAQVLPGIFEMNLPEGFIRRYLIEALRKNHPIDDMLFLSLAGPHAIGNIVLRDPNRIPHDTAGETLEDILKTRDSSYFSHLVERYLLISAGISGVQPKILVPERGTLKCNQLIVKKGEDHFPHLAANEFLCLKIAQQAGVETADFWLSDDQTLLVSTRFDRLAGQSLAVEDMAVLMGKRSDQKYEGSYENVMKAAELYNLDKSVLFQRIALSMVLGDGDAHLKNFAVTYSDPGYFATLKWSPAYDVVCTKVYQLEDKPALKFLGRKTFPTRQELTLWGNKHGIKAAEAIVDNIVEAAVAILKNDDYRDFEITPKIEKQVSLFFKKPKPMPAEIHTKN